MSAWTDLVTCKDDEGFSNPIPTSPIRLKSEIPSIVIAALPLLLERIVSDNEPEFAKEEVRLLL